MKPLRHAPADAQEPATGFSRDRLSIAASNNTTSFRKLMLVIGRYAAKAGLSERRKNLRVSARELIAGWAPGPEEKYIKVKDISPTGAYLLTSYRWILGTNFLLALENGSRTRSEFQPRVRLRAKVVRFGEDGVGVNFVHEHFDDTEWRAFTSKAASLFPDNGAVRMLRAARTLAFLHRISPSTEGRILKLFGEELSDERIERALEIALRAEEMIDSRDTVQKYEIVSSLLLRILSDGSKNTEASIQQCWSGLLASSLFEGSNASEYPSFAVLLSKLEPVHTRILAEAGQMAFPAGIQFASPTSPVHCPVGAMKQIARTPNVRVIECALNRLHELGLLELTIRPFGFESLEQANLTLTRLGLGFYKACFGQQ